MKYLVTGVAGFIGSSLAKKLIALGNDIVGVDNLSSGKIENIPLGVEFYDVDINDNKRLREINLSKVDAVLHLASQSSGEISYDNPQYDLNTNAIGTFNLLKLCVKNNITRFIYTSTVGVYGIHKELPTLESDQTLPISYYGISKLAGEHYARSFMDKLDITILRLTNTYGPGQDINNVRQGMVSIYLAYLLRNKEIHIKGSADRYRDHIFIDDVVDIFIDSLSNKKSIGNTYNLSTGQKTTIAELISKLLYHWGDEKHPVKYEGNTPGDIFGIYLDNSSLKKDFDKKEFVSLDQGLSKFINWSKNLQKEKINEI